MKFFLDTANIEHIRDAASLGLIEGVTTNPSLISKEKKPFKDIILEICKIVDGPISAEVTSSDYRGMVDEALKLSDIHKNVVVKVPMTKDGLKAVKSLSEQGVKTNVTLVFSATQALLAAKVGASYVSPFVGRLDDISTDGMNLVAEIQQIYRNYFFETEVIIASIRHPIHVLQAALVGADIATVPYDVLMKTIKHPLTDIGIEKFMSDWKKVEHKEI
ncbi:MAG TPA: fructose-6-phosphate aldolase [Methanofastidiosum sp.]|jgi:transaldolase|nr:fructose-6-phosphate aldolase [Candidatus Methanofastidiosa archaeon]HOE93164.1 fructose-6-phosphate aldolase [Methanofastidiosum sp.]HOM95221.1 fructose-6-phosphate aldolase [Methanofastidiosum sp.]HOR87797.1 fructose-6-phosphate aldolase [Methanofastidiosum sp.]HPC80558.1 fructose-6-phosphate aldolase [Methanofastidiosum sp.]